METLNEFILMGRIGREGIKRFDYTPPKSFNPDGTPKVKLGMEFFLEVPQSIGGGDIKIRLVTYNRSPIENLLGKFVVIKGFFKVQTYTNEDGEKNYITKLVVQENGGVIYYGGTSSYPTAQNVQNRFSNSGMQPKGKNDMAVKQVFGDSIVDEPADEDEWIDSQLADNDDIWG